MVSSCLISIGGWAGVRLDSGRCEVRGQGGFAFIGQLNYVRDMLVIRPVKA